MSSGLASSADVAALLPAVASMPAPDDDAERIDRLRHFEALKAAICAEQAVLAVSFAACQRAAQQAAGVPAERADRGIGGQLGLALRRSPYAATRWLGFARIATTELPATFAALRAGQTSEWRAMLVARETALLSRQHRGIADAQIAPRLGELGDRGVEVETRRIAHRLDPHAALARASKAETERRVTIRPAPDAMAYLTALLPCAQAVAAYAALGRHADTTVTGGDARGRGQIMADTLVERVTGQTTAAGLPIEVELLIDADTLAGLADEPAELLSYGPIPAGTARDLIHGPDKGGARRGVRRVYTHTTTDGTNENDTRVDGDDLRVAGGDLHAGRTSRGSYVAGTRLVAMDSSARYFTTGQRRFVRFRDHDRCRTPYCDAPIRHIDHVTDWAHGGPTHVGNAQGTCQTCNHTSQAPGWTQHATGDGTVETTTPTGHRYRSHTPTPPGAPPARPPDRRTHSRLEHQFRRRLGAA